MSEKKKKKVPKTVVILGFSDSIYREMLIPENAEIWSINNCWDCNEFKGLPIHRIFDIHYAGFHDNLPKTLWERVQFRLGIKHWCRPPRDGRRYVEHWREHLANGTRVILSEPHPEAPGTEAYPIERVLRAFSCGAPDGTSRSPFMNTFHYMMALAVLEGFDIIMVYGCDNSDFEHRPDDFAQMFWFGVAQGRGIMLGGALPQLNPFPLYGYTNDHEALRKRRSMMLWRGIWGAKFVYFWARLLYTVGQWRATLHVLNINRKIKRINRMEARAKKTDKKTDQIPVQRVEPVDQTAKGEVCLRVEEEKKA